MSSIEASGSLKYTDPLSSIIFPALVQVDGEIMITSEREYLESNEGHLAMYHSYYPVDISFPSLVTKLGISYLSEQNKGIPPSAYPLLSDDTIGVNSLTGLWHSNRSLRPSLHSLIHGDHGPPTSPLSRELVRFIPILPDHRNRKPFLDLG